MTPSGDQRTFLVMIFHKLDPLYIGLNFLFHKWSLKVLYWGVEGDFSDLKCLHRISWSIALIFWYGALGRPLCMLESGELSYYETKRIKWYVICGTFTTQTSTTASYIFNQVRSKVRINEDNLAGANNSFSLTRSQKEDRGRGFPQGAGGWGEREMQGILDFSASPFNLKSVHSPHIKKCFPPSSHSPLLFFSRCVHSQQLSTTYS